MVSYAGRVPAANEERRRALADAAIELLAEAGVHGVTHRAVERRAGLPAGTASNYFRTRELLLVAVVQRVVALHLAEMAEAGREELQQRRSAGADGSPAGTAHRLEDLLTASLVAAATTHRRRYLAIFELRLESLRRPALADALSALVEESALSTAGHHADLGLAVPRERVVPLLTLYGGILFTLVTAPAGTITDELVRPLVATAVSGALSTGAPAAAPDQARRSAGEREP